MLCLFCVVLSITRRPPTSPLFPYTTLFRSRPLLFGGEVVRFKVRIIWREEGFANGVGRQTPEPSGVCRPAGWSGPSRAGRDRKSTRLNSSHTVISYAVFCLKKKKTKKGTKT